MSMEYFVRRGEQRFGPYSLSDLQKYVQSGNLVASDLAQSEGMADWVPLSQVLGNIPAMTMGGGGVAAARGRAATIGSTAAESALVDRAHSRADNAPTLQPDLGTCAG